MIKNLPASAGYRGPSPGSEKSSGEANGNPLQYSYLENSMDRGVWQAIQSIESQRIRHDWAIEHTHSLF